MTSTWLHAERTRGIAARLARDYTYVLPGFPIALFSFSLLLVMTVLSTATAIIWVGTLLMPLTLVVASGFAELDRSRLRGWGAEAPAVAYQPLGVGVKGRLRALADPRRWLDLVFEMLITIAMRMVTFTVAVSWSLAGPAAVTYFFWSLFLPEQGVLLQLLGTLNPVLVPLSATGQYALDAGGMFLFGLALLATLPAVIHALAAADASLSTALLTSGEHEAAEADLTSAVGGTYRTASFSPAAWSWIGTGFAALVLFSVGWPVTAAVHGVNVVIALILVGVHCGTVVLTLYRPWIGLALSLGAAGGLMLAAGDSSTAPWPWPVTSLITQSAVLMVAALARPWYLAVSAWCAGAVLTLVALLSVPDMPDRAMANSIVYAALTAGVVVIGVLVRIWILNAGRLEAAERTSAQQDRRRKELQERNRIARELHDVVAHSMSVISVQAATAQYRIPDMGATALREFDEIAGSSRQALSEMRMLLSILRGDDEVPTAPEPGLEDIDRLIDSTRASGTTITYSGLNLSEDIHAPPATGLAAYRIVQEALSNALRHAPFATVEVDVSTEAQDQARRLRIAVVNGPSPEEAVDPAPGAGLGLSGIRERATAVGGSVTAEHTADGGFAVRAVLPL
ncbi:sensor histidine kinase [Nesterenkonia natronophila]|uniref:histidine kinase n=1 Tax=Nesterenkonia natronophila TaxID=2174932 RepID=A0A3A4F482_9MICC|nr:sensor histidine kinase [Nesterenkonia natronophila]RJN32626.1 sensor histidine kinase [Nesterenkonia natronophila]